MPTQPDPDAIRDAVLALLVAVEHDPAAVEVITVTPGFVEVRDSQTAGRNSVTTTTWRYEWSLPLV